MTTILKDIEEVLGADYTTRGLSWAEGVYTGVENLEVAAFDAYAHDIVNMVGARAKYTLCDTTTVNGYYRHESDIGKGADHGSDMFGASVQQIIGDVMLEPGFLSIAGDTLKFTESGTGINHPLGASMMIYANQFDGGADNYYLKATTKIKNTSFYMLYNYTTHDEVKFEGQEINLIVKQPITDQLTACFKGAVGYHDGNQGADDQTASDVRLFVTYNF